MHRSSETIGAIATALAKAQAELSNPERTLTATFPLRNGARSFRYGATRRWVDRLRVVLADGTVREFGSRAGHFHLCETNGGPFGTGGLDFPGVLAALDQSGYDRFVSVKVYRGADHDAAARTSAEFLRRVRGSLG